MYEPHRGVWVRVLTPAEARELAVVRAALEGVATRLAVPRLTSEDVERLDELQERLRAAVTIDDDEAVTIANADWHRTIYAAAGGSFVYQHVMRLWIPYPWTRVWNAQRKQASVAQHDEILAAMREGDAERAGELMHDHILFQCNSVVADMEQQAAAS